MKHYTEPIAELVLLGRTDVILTSIYEEDYHGQEGETPEGGDLMSIPYDKP